MDTHVHSITSTSAQSGLVCIAMLFQNYAARWHCCLLVVRGSGHRHMGSSAGRLTYKHTDRHADRHTDRHTDRNAARRQLRHTDWNAVRRQLRLTDAFGNIEYQAQVHRVSGISAEGVRHRHTGCHRHSAAGPGGRHT